MDWLRLTETLRQRRLLPALGPRILDMAEGRASDDFAAAVEQAITIGRRHGAFLQLISQRAMDALADAGIRSAAIKGPLLGEAIYSDPGRRLSSDIDLLVAMEQLHAAVEVVRQLGYAAPTDYVQGSGLPLLHFTLVHERRELPLVELHWRVHWYERDFARERLLPSTCDQQDGWRPALADELAALLLFYARDGFVDLRLASDLSAWWDIYGADLPLGALDELLSVYPALARVIPAAVKAAENAVGLPAAQIIRRMPKLDLRERTAVRLANPNPHASQSQLYAEVGLIDGLLMPRGGLGAFIRRQVILPPEVLDELDRRAPKRRARSSLGRGAGMLGRYGLAAARLVHAPESCAEGHGTMKSHAPTTCAYHFGPSTDYVGGMASVIAMLVTQQIGAERVIAVPTWVPGSHVRSGLLAARAVALVLRLPRRTAVHVHMSEGGSFVREAVILAAAKCRRLPLVVTIHGPGFAEFSKRRPHLVGAVLRMASAITVLSDLDLAAVRRVAPSAHVEILPNPMPLDSLADPVADTSEVVLFAGEVGLRKGADVLQQAWEVVAHHRPLAKCIVVGPATELRLPDTERFEVRGPVDLAQVKQLIREARVIALPSRGEALPMILTEAMAAGRPFVSTPTGGIASLADGGLIVPVEDHAALADALIALLADPERAQALGSAGRALCRKRMSPEAVGARLRQLYNR